MIIIIMVMTVLTCIFYINKIQHDATDAGT